MFTARRLLTSVTPSSRLVNTSQCCIIPDRHFSHTSIRTKQEYLIQVPDFENTTAQRLAAKRDHIIGATPLIECKQLSYFGVTLTNEGANATINGSVMVMEAGSRDEILEILAKDAYTKAGVWDVRNAKITPFRAG